MRLGGEDGVGGAWGHERWASRGRRVWSIGNGHWRVSEALPKVLSLTVIRRDIVQRTRTLKKPLVGLTADAGGPAAVIQGSLSGQLCEELRT